MLGCGCSVCPQAGRHRHRLSGCQRQRRGEGRSARRDRPVHSAHRVVCARLLLPHDAWQPLPRRRKYRVRGSNSFRLIPGANPRPSSPPIPSLGARCTRAAHSLSAPTRTWYVHLVPRAPLRSLLESVGGLGLHPHLLIELRALVCGACGQQRPVGASRARGACWLRVRWCVRSRRSGHLRRVRVGTVWVYDIHWGAGGVLACWEVD